MARRQVGNAIRRDLLQEHRNALWAARAALVALWDHDGIEWSAVNPNDSRSELLMAIVREDARSLIDYSRLIDDTYGIVETKKVGVGRFAGIKQPRPFDDLECAPEYGCAPGELLEVARRRAEDLATARILIEAGYSSRAVVAALDPKLTTVKSRQLPHDRVKAADRARARVKAQLQDRLERLEKRRAECEVKDSSRFGYLKQASLPDIKAAIRWVKKRLSPLEM